MANWEPNELVEASLLDDGEGRHAPYQMTALDAKEQAQRLTGNHYEVSPREREDDLERDRRDFDPEPEEHVWYEVRIVDDED